MVVMAFWRRFKDPISGGTHLVGAVIGGVASVYLILRSWHHGPWDIRAVSSFAIFGATLVLLYLASSAYHLLDVSERARRVLRLLDHGMIFVFIAGSYTPFCLISLRGRLGDRVLIVIWTCALAGLLIKLFWMHAPRILSTVLYLAMGWLALTVIAPLRHALSGSGLGWLVAGGVCYSLGAVIYALKRPDPFPAVFGFHEIWHLFVLGGSFCHFRSVATLVG